MGLVPGRDSYLCLRASRTPGETEAIKLEGHETGVEAIRKADALNNGLAVKWNVCPRLARAVVGVPDGETVAKESILGVNEGLERVVVDAPVAVHGGLIASQWSGSDIGLELGLSLDWEADITLLP